MELYGSLQVNNGELVLVACQFDIASGAVSATRGDGVTASKVDTGDYQVLINGEDFYQCVGVWADVLTSDETVKAYPRVTAVDVNGAGDGTGATVLLSVVDDNATPAATDITAGTVSVLVAFQRSPMV